MAPRTEWQWGTQPGGGTILPPLFAGALRHLPPDPPIGTPLLKFPVSLRNPELEFLPRGQNENLCCPNEECRAQVELVFPSEFNGPAGEGVKLTSNESIYWSI